MTVSVFYNGKEYILPESIERFDEYQDDSMKTYDEGWTYRLTLSHLKIVDISTDENPYLRYKLFVGIMPTNRDTKIIIYGEYFIDRPYRHGSFHYIEVPESEMIDFDRINSKFILDIGNNSCAILLKDEVIVIGITTDFQEYLEPEEVDDYDEDIYGEPYLSIIRINLVRDITDFPFDRSSVDGRLSVDKRITSNVEKDDSCYEVCFCFTCVCSSSDKIHSKTKNEITITLSDEQIRIRYDMDTTTYDHYMLAGTEYNDFPTMRTHQKNDCFHDEITYERFPEEDSEEEDD